MGVVIHKTYVENGVCNQAKYFLFLEKLVYCHKLTFSKTKNVLLDYKLRFVCLLCSGCSIRNASGHESSLHLPTQINDI